MISLIEAYRENDELPFHQGWQLREVEINPDYIIKMCVDKDTQSVNKKGYISDKLASDVDFTRIYLAFGHSAIICSSITQIKEKIKVFKKFVY